LYKPIVMCPPKLERNYDFRKFMVLRIFINSWNGLAILNRMNKA